jgi:hypothetical protein
MLTARQSICMQVLRWKPEMSLECHGPQIMHRSVTLQLELRSIISRLIDHVGFGFLHLAQNDNRVVVVACQSLCVGMK